MWKKSVLLIFIFCLCLLLGQSNQTSQGSWQVFTQEDGLPTNKIHSVFEDLKGNIWVTTVKSGVAKYDGSTWRTFNKENGLVSNFANYYYLDSKGNIYFVRNAGSGPGVRYGVTKYDGSKLETSKKPWYIRQVYEDSAGNIWLCTSNGLINWKSADDFIRFNKKDGLASSSVFAICEDSSKRLWVGTTNGISVYDGTNWETFDDKNGATKKFIIAILEDKKGNMWFGTKEGVYCYDGKDWMSYTKDNGLPSNDVLMMKMDSKGLIWVCFGGKVSGADLVGIASALIHRSGVVKFDGEKMTGFTSKDGAPPTKVVRLNIDSKDNIWCDTFTVGIYRHDGTQWSDYRREKGFYVNHYTGFYEDRNGHLWFSTESGVLYFDRENWTRYTKEDGLPTNNTTSIMEDSKGNIWIGTNNGLVKYSR